MVEIESIWLWSVEMVAVLRPSRVERQYYLSRLKISFRDHINPNCFLFLTLISCAWKRSSNFWCVSVTVVPVFRRLHSLYTDILEIWQSKLKRQFLSVSSAHASRDRLNFLPPFCCSVVIEIFCSVFFWNTTSIQNFSENCQNSETIPW